MNERKTSSINFVDCSRLYSLGAYLDRFTDGSTGPVQYGAIQKVLDEQVRVRNGLRRSDASLAFVTGDTSSEASVRFAQALQAHGYTVESMDFRDAFVTSGPKPSTAPSERLKEQSLIASIAFSLGALWAKAAAAKSTAEFVIVSDSYELAMPLERIRAHGGKVMLAWFKDLLDPRWFMRGRLDEKVSFYDLTEHAEVLIPGTKPSHFSMAKAPRLGGLDSLL